MATIHKNMTLADALEACPTAGADVRQGKGGEFVVTFPGRHPLRINGRRRDCPQVLVARLRQAVRP